MIDTKELTKLFLDLVKIDGVSLREHKVADFIKTRYQCDKLQIIEEKPIPDGDTGNLICIPTDVDLKKPVVLLSAHLDTVESTRDLQPVIENGVIHSDGTTILGADNRAGVAALLYLLKSYIEGKISLTNTVIIFTVAEELGLVGARYLDLSRFSNVGAAYVFDCSKRPGIFIQHCYGSDKFKATVYGKSAHAGVNPESGINAIAITAKIITEIKQGKLENDATLNIGKIHGGEATNVVPSMVWFEGEVRGPDTETIEKYISHVKKIVADIGASMGGRSEVSAFTSFVPYVHSPDSFIYKNAIQFLSSVNLHPEPIIYSGGSDANVFYEKGIPSVNFGIGAQKPHSTEEFILIKDLVKTTELVMEVAKYGYNKTMD